MQPIDNHKVSEPLRLTYEQQRLFELLKEKETDTYPVSEWYIGALYALENPHNPDRISQAAQSLRELLEKLPRVIEGSDVQGDDFGFADMRRQLNERFLKDKESYPDGWKDKTINVHLAKTLRKFGVYLERNQQPTRKERIGRAVATIDPLDNRFDREIREKKRNRFYKLWRKLEDFAHHSRKQDNESFNKCLEDLERMVFDLLAPITAQDQREIQTILRRSDRSEIDVERMFSLIQRRGANYVFFFKQAGETADTAWLSHLDHGAYFANPRNAEPIGEGTVNYPFWWPIHYLAKISKHAPEKVIEIVIRLPKVNNPSVYDGILEIALALRGKQSSKLLPKILESLKLEHQVWTYQYADLLAHWTKENQVEATLELSKILVAFVPDPRDKDKWKRRKDMSQDSAEIATILAETELEPSPRIDQMEYHRIISEGVRPLAEKEPYKVACTLIDVTADMIRLRTHWENFDKGVDYSEFWCERFAESEDNHEAADKSLVHALAFACQQVYELRSDSIHELDDDLRNQHWRIFKRLRQHLYAQYPSKQTKPWIRELILEHEDYNQSEHCYEFQQMIRSACEHFGETLITKAERTQIFDAICGGPSKEDFQESLGEKFTEEKFQQRQRYFHRKQFKPFAPLLFGKYATFFQELEQEANAPISDEDYPPYKTRSGWVSNRSPRPPSDLSKLTDEELLIFINEWEGEEPIYEGNDLIEVNIEGLAVAFQTVFKEQIIPDPKRLRFWMKNRRRIERPIYVRMMINSMQTDVKEKHFDNLNEWLTFSEWVLSHPDQELKEDYRRGRQGDESREIPNWYNSRRAVGNLIKSCLESDVDVPISDRAQLAKLLERLCTRFDSWLDRGKKVFPNQNDLIAEGINNTRSRALEALVQFGFWLRGHDSESDAPEVTSILEKRFAEETEHPLTLPEYAILGKNYNRIFLLNERWATEHKSDFFPQGELPAWLAAFNSFMRYNSPFKVIFEILRDDFDFALQHLTDFKNQAFAEKKLTETLSEHLFHYYMLDMYALSGENSLLERFYQVTEHDRKQWASLFDYVGRTLRDTSEQLEQNLIDRIINFFDWRIQVKEPIELQRFTFWLKAKCLDAEWRLDAFSKILDVCKAEDVSIAIQLEALCEMLPDHTAKVVECFAKLTDRRGDDNIYIRTERAKSILQAGLASPEKDVYENAKRAHDNLLRVGRFDLLDLDD